MTRFQGGWAEDRTLFVGFGEKSVYRTEVAAVYSVDLVTGNRKVLSGGYVSNPGDEYSAQKVASVGSGPSFGIISVIRRLRPGKLFVRSYNGLFVVDEATGNRDKIAIDEASGCGKNVSLSADITSDGKVVMAYDDNRSSGISVFDMQTKKCLHHLQPYGESFYCPCGRLGPGVPGEPLR